MQSLGKETSQVAANLSIGRAWEGIFTDFSVSSFLLSEKGWSKKPQHAVDKSSYVGTEPVSLDLTAGAAAVWAGWLGPGKPSAVSSTNSVFSLTERENYIRQACGFKRFVWARTEIKIVDVPHFHDIGMMTLSSYCLIRPFSAFRVINKLLPQWLTIHILFLKFLFLWQIFTKSKSYQPFPEVVFISTSLPSEHSTQCFEFQWIIRKGRMGSTIWKWLQKLTVPQKYASFFFSSANSNTKQRYWNRCQTTQWRKQCKHELCQQQPTQLDHKGEQKLKCMNPLKWVKWSAREQSEVYTGVCCCCFNVSKIWYHWKLAGLKLLKWEITAERFSF